MDRKETQFLLNIEYFTFLEIFFCSIQAYLQPRGGRGGLPYMGYIGTCCRIGYGFLGSQSLNRVSFFTLLFLCPWCGP